MQAWDYFPMPRMSHRVERFISLPLSVMAYDVLSLSGERIQWTLLNNTHTWVEPRPGQGLFFHTVKEANSIEWDLPPGSALIHRQMIITESIWFG